MPLVEVIRGKKSSEKAISTAVLYATSMGKTPLVVNDCAGFLVNRVLFPYFSGFAALINDGVNFQKIDRVMEKFGWPMGPAYLIDVVGIDTAHHANQVMKAEFPDRMGDPDKSNPERSAIHVLFSQKRYEIVERMMLPMIFEVFSLFRGEDRKYTTEVDLGVIYGLGFPPFRGGVLRYADTLGAATLCKLGDKYARLGKLYQPTEQVILQGKSGKSFY
ncbi:unnamed protein product [Sphagnum tenellum]